MWNGDTRPLAPFLVRRYYKSHRAVSHGANTALDLASPYSRQLQLSSTESALVSAAVTVTYIPAAAAYNTFSKNGKRPYNQLLP